MLPAQYRSFANVGTREGGGRTEDEMDQARGFTLLEVLAAGFILTLTILGLSASLANGSRLAEGSREELSARAALRDVMAKLDDAPFDAVAVTYHRKGFEVEGLHTTAADPDGLPGEIVFEDGPTGTQELYRVSVSVRWHGVMGDRVLEEVRYLANVRGDPGTAPVIAEVEKLQAQLGNGVY